MLVHCIDVLWVNTQNLTGLLCNERTSLSAITQYIMYVQHFVYLSVLIHSIDIGKH